MKRRVCPGGWRPEFGAGSDKEVRHFLVLEQPPSLTWSARTPLPPGCRKAQILGLWERRLTFSLTNLCWAPPGPLPLVLSSLALPACLSVSPLCECVDLSASCIPLSHTHAALSVRLCLSEGLFCAVTVSVFLSGFLFLLFSLVVFCLTVSLSSSVPLGFCLSACQSFSLSLYPVSLAHTLSIHPYGYLYFCMLGFSCPTIDSKGGLSFMAVEHLTVSTPA